MRVNPASEAGRLRPGLAWPAVLASAAVKTHHDRGTLLQEAFIWGLAYSFSDLVDYRPGRKHGSREHGGRQASCWESS